MNMTDQELADIAKARNLWNRIAPLLIEAEANLPTMHVHVAIWLMLTSVLVSEGTDFDHLVASFEEMLDDTSEPPDIPDIN